MAANYEKSVFYQLDLDDIAGEFAHYGLPAPELLPDDAPLMQRIHNRMLRARIEKLGGKDFKTDEQGAFALLREGLLADMYAKKSRPHLNVYSDQIVWGRSPVRIDVAGGWTDTPPYSLFAGGNVVNMAIELNGQPPLQVYVKPCKELRIVLRSIDMGAMEVVSTFDELQDYRQVGSPFRFLRQLWRWQVLCRLSRKLLILLWKNSWKHSVQESKSHCCLLFRQVPV